MSNIKEEIKELLAEATDVVKTKATTIVNNEAYRRKLKKERKKERKKSAPPTIPDF